MDANLKLYGGLSQLLELNKKSDQDKLLKILSKYQINYKVNNSNFNELINKWIEIKTLEGISDTTLKYYKNISNNFYEYFKKKSASSYTKNDIKKFISYKEKSVSKQSIYIILNVINGFFNWCLDEGLINQNPCKGIKYKHIKSQRTYIKKEDIEKIRRSCNNLFEKCIIEFLLSTGCRISEVYKIKLVDVDFKNNTVIVTGKGNKSRIVIFNNKTKKLLKKLNNDGEYLFCKNCIHITKEDISKVVKDTAKRANIEYNICPHMYRHTFATSCLEKGMDISIISKLLGHSNISTTQVYAELNMNNVMKSYKEIFEWWKNYIMISAQILNLRKIYQKMIYLNY